MYIVRGKVDRDAMCPMESFRSIERSRAIRHSVRKTDSIFARDASSDKNEIKILLINRRDASQASFSKNRPCLPGVYLFVTEDTRDSGIRHVRENGGEE